MRIQRQFHTGRLLSGVAALASALLIGALLAAPAMAQPTGDADFTNYVAIGDSLTAGFISGGLIDEVQVNSYPSLIFQRATGAPASAFQQPLVSAPGIPGLMQLRSLTPVVITAAQGLGTPLNLNLPRPYSNLAVPGADVAEALRTVSDGFLHDLILRGIGTQLEQAVGQGATFVSVWLGNNDALAAATSGVAIEGVTLTPAASFDADYRTIINTLAASGAQLVVATVPDVTAIPFTTTVAPVLVNPATSQPVLVNGQPVPLLGPDGPLVPGRDFVLLTATQELAVGNGIPVALGGSGLPLSNQVVLSAAEVSAIRGRTAQFNDTIRSAAASSGAAVADIAAVFADIARNGLTLGGIDFSAQFLTGGLFSFDGVHATPLGYAIVANAFIDAINARYNANIPRVGLGPYVFGPLSSRGTGIDSAVVAGMKFSRSAEDQIRHTLGVPSRRDLRVVMRRLGITDVPPRPDNGSGGGNGGGNNGGNGGGGNNGGNGGGSSTCSLPAGHPKYCDFCGPCSAGQGDCDLKPNQCAEGLVCVQDVGAGYGFHRKIDVCQAP